MKSFLSILAICLLAPQARGQKTYLLEGSIGTNPVYMQLEDYSKGSTDKAIEARYFYTSSLKDIALQGSVSHGKYALLVNSQKGSFDEKLVLRKTDGNVFSGTWTGKSGKELPVKLSPVALDKITQPFARNATVKRLRSQDSFNYIRASFISLKRDSTTIYKNKTLVWLSEAHCSMSLFRLGGNGFTRTTLHAVNDQLDAIQFEQIVNQLSCAPVGEYNTGKGIEYTTTLTFLSRSLLGFEISSSWFCGGPHPDFGSKGYLLDLKDGKQYELDDIIAFDTSVTVERADNFERFSAYRTRFFAPALYGIINVQEHFKKPANADDCDYTDEDIWHYPAWNFTENGIAFTPVFSRAARACEEAYLVPFEALRMYKNPAFPYGIGDTQEPGSIAK